MEKTKKKKPRWKVYDGPLELDRYVICTWHFRPDPYQCVVEDSSMTLAGALSRVAAQEFEEEVTVAKVTQWIENGDEVVPRPGYIKSLYTITPQGDDDEDDRGPW